MVHRELLEVPLRPVQRRLAFVVSRIDVRAGGQQRSRRVRVAAFGGIVQRRFF
mgnify:CR=1 FL=1